MGDHPTTEELKAFIGGRRGPGSQVFPGNRQVVRHLLAKCPVCQALLQEVAPTKDPTPTGQLLPSDKHDYSRAFARAERTLSYFLADGKPAEEPSGELLAEIVLLSEDARSRPLPSESRFAIPFLIRWLVDRSHAHRYRSPEKVLEWALLARLASDACSSEVAGNSARLADLRCRAWGQLGNALRICSRLGEAEEMFSKAREYCAAGTGDPLVRGLLFQQIASLHYFERRVDDAFQMSREAEEIYATLGETQHLARTRITRALVDTRFGEPKKAALLLEGTIPLIDGKDDPYLLLAARHNLVHCYVDLGQPDKALDRYLAAKPLKSLFHEPLITSRIAWQEGELFHQLGSLEFAEAAFLKAREGFVELGLTYEVALVANQLATVYLEMGADDKLEHSVSQTLSYCRTRMVCREAKSSLAHLERMTFR